MAEYDLEKYTLRELKNIAGKMGLVPRRTRAEMIKDISTAFSEYEEYKKDKIDKYTRIRQLGIKGKEGTTYLVKDSRGREYAMKTFRREKSSKRLVDEYALQKKAAKEGAAPRVYDYDTVGKWILMEKMDSHLQDQIMRKGKLSKKHQKRILEIFSKLDDAGVFHNDANIQNYMLKDNTVYLIDYGFAKEITPKLKKKLGTEHPNSRMMLISLILKLREINVSEGSYKYLLKNVKKEDRERFNLP